MINQENCSGCTSSDSDFEESLDEGRPNSNHLYHETDYHDEIDSELELLQDFEYFIMLIIKTVGVVSLTVAAIIAVRRFLNRNS